MQGPLLDRCCWNTVSRLGVNLKRVYLGSVAILQAAQLDHTLLVNSG